MGLLQLKYRLESPTRYSIHWVTAQLLDDDLISTCPSTRNNRYAVGSDFKVWEKVYASVSQLQALRSPFLQPLSWAHAHDMRGFCAPDFHRCISIGYDTFQLIQKSIVMICKARSSRDVENEIHFFHVMLSLGCSTTVQCKTQSVISTGFHARLVGAHVYSISV